MTSILEHDPTTVAPAPTLATPAVAADDSLLRRNANPATLDAVQLSAWFGDRKVLERCSLTMEAKKVTALIGPSGCGKSTFLRILNRMHEVVPSAKIAGRVDLDGVDIYGRTLSATEVRTRIGMVFQKPNPFPAMTIRQNVLAGLKLSGTHCDDRDRLVEECLTRAGLWDEVKDRLDEGGTTLSGGQQQRLCIARALAVSPQVLLMDEPCSALDPISTRVVEETITDLAHDITIVIVTHNMQQAQRVSDRCAFFLVESQKEPGRIVEAGDTAQLFDRPSDPRTLDYVTGRFG
jgi:phosphate transport system ATP-binding protein